MYCSIAIIGAIIVENAWEISVIITKRFLVGNRERIAQIITECIPSGVPTEILVEISEGIISKIPGITQDDSVYGSQKGILEEF